MTPLELYLGQCSDLLLKTASRKADILTPVEATVNLLVTAAQDKKPILVCGNGGSAADAQHIAGELVHRFQVNRRAINCLALSANSATLTAIANDDDFREVFSRQVEAHGQEGGVLLGISTSGKSANILKALQAARGMRMRTVGLTGQAGGEPMQTFCDVLIKVPSFSTPMIQQVHECLYHYICDRIEKSIVPNQ